MVPEERPQQRLSGNQTVALKIKKNLIILKAVFSEENYVPQTANWVGTHAYCSLLCHNDTGWNQSIIWRESMHKHNFGQTLKIQSAVVTLNIRSRSLISNSLFLSANIVSMQVWCRKIHLFRRQSSGNGWFTVFLRMVTIIMRGPWTKIISTLYFATMIQCIKV